MSIKHREHNRFPGEILIRDFSGQVAVRDIIGSWQILLEQNQITEATRGVINNITGCELQMDLESFKELISFLKSNEKFRRIKLAVISDDPRTIVFPTLGEKREQELKIKPFSTLDAAEEWILSS